jgi:hypothetical protein
MAGDGAEEKCFNVFLVKILLTHPLKSQKLFYPTSNIN